MLGKTALERFSNLLLERSISKSHLRVTLNRICSCEELFIAKQLWRNSSSSCSGKICLLSRVGLFPRQNPGADVPLIFVDLLHSPTRLEGSSR